MNYYVMTLFPGNDRAGHEHEYYRAGDGERIADADNA